MSKFVIIDGNALIHRAFHALPPLSTSKGKIVNAVYGFALVLLKVLKELKPDFIAVAFDHPAPTFRHKEFKEYKATRVKAPQELYDQIPLVKRLVEAFNITAIEREGYEADDIIGFIKEKAQKEKKDIQNIIVTGDLDTLQLIDDKTKVLTFKKGVSESVIYDEEKVKQKYGINPEQLIDFKALRGDPSDNIPGVKGIGEKTALKLIQKFGSLENLYQNLEKADILPRMKKLLLTYKDQAFLSKKLAQIITRLPLEFHLENCTFASYDRDKVVKLLQELEFKSLLDKLPPSNKNLSANSKENKYFLVSDYEIFKKVLEKLSQVSECALKIITDTQDIFSAQILGIALAFKEKEAYFIPLDSNFDILKEIKPYLEASKLNKIGHNLKQDFNLLALRGIYLKPLAFDCQIASYLLNFGTQVHHDLATVAFGELGLEIINDKKLKEINPQNLSSSQLTEIAGTEVDVIWRLKKRFEEKLEKISRKTTPEPFGKISIPLKGWHLKKVFKEIESPLVEVLAKMEKWGVKIDTDLLKQKSEDFSLRLKKLEEKIYELAGQKFNINSPKQLKEILFEKLGLATEDIKRTKTGYSTAASELEKLKETHPLIPLIMEYREYSKLKSTYLDALPQLVNSKTGRVHTSFNQTITATGRLSSSNPNLQNIPIKGEEGKAIRQAFIAEKGFKLLSADYSQIELRIAAEFSQDERMRKSFLKGEDIHTRTAAEINNCSLEEVTFKMRRRAKAVNFGVIYGLSAYGLAQQENISPEEAQAFIDRYFALYPQIQNYITETLKRVRRLGYAETLFGRRRYLPDINSSVAQLRRAAERMAINMPIQGTAADIIKLAMIKIYKTLPKISPQTKMILQVHDELVFEVPSEEVSLVAKIIKEIMENIVTLSVPLKVELKQGDNWADLEKINH